MNQFNNFVIRGSSCGIVRNGEFVGDSDVVCPRKSLLRHVKIEETHSATTQAIFAIGHQFEKYFETLHPECEFEKLIIVDKVLEGHADAVSSDMVYELKSVTSKNSKKKYIKERKCKVENVLQLATYLSALEMNKGQLIYGDYTHICTYDKLVKMHPDQIASLFEGAIPEMHVFEIEINEQGYVLVDGQHFHNINVTELFEFQDKLHELVKARVLPPRIEQFDTNSWGGPCKYCKLSPLCDSAVDDLEEWIDLAAQIYEEQI